MNETKKFVIIGVGNCGSQVALLAEKKYDELFDCIYINTSKSDLAMVKTESDLKFKIGGTEDVEGSGKNRTKMKEYLKKDIVSILSNEKFQECVSYKKYCVIVTSAAGGTGSGASPILLDILRSTFPDTNFILVAVLPQISASLMEHGNSLEFTNELYDVLGNDVTYMIYDNESTSNLPPTKALEVVNANIVEDLKVLTGVDNYPTPFESIDEADMESIITTPGRLVVVRLNKGLTEKTMEDNKIDDMIVKELKKSSHAETDRNKRVIRWGIITYFTEAVNNLYVPNLDSLQEFIGTPIERFNHNAINKEDENLNFLHVIASGMSPINDRVRKITTRINELKSALATDESSKYILSGDGASYEELSKLKREEKRKGIDKEVNLSSLFNKFMK